LVENCYNKAIKELINNRMGFWEKLTGKKEVPRSVQEEPKTPAEKSTEIAKSAEKKFMTAEEAYNEVSRKKIKDGPFLKERAILNEALEWMSAEAKNAEKELKNKLRDKLGGYAADKIFTTAEQEGTNFVAVGKRKVREIGYSWSQEDDALENLYYSLASKARELGIQYDNVRAAAGQYEQWRLGDIRMEIKGAPEYRESSKTRFGDISPDKVVERVEHKVKKAPSGDQSVESFLAEQRRPKY
jgi:hypothetical protein